MSIMSNAIRDIVSKWLCLLTLIALPLLTLVCQTKVRQFLGITAKARGIEQTMGGL